jgi:hypothetical protein
MLSEEDLWREAARTNQDWAWVISHRNVVGVVDPNAAENVR